MIERSLTKLRTTQDVRLTEQEITIGKHRILAEIARKQEQREHISLSVSEQTRLFSMRCVRKCIPSQYIVAAIAILLFVSVPTTFMTRAAIPGDALWPMKITIEKAEIAFAMDAAYEGRLHIKHVNNRLRELKIITLKPESTNKSKNISQLVRRLEKDITAANQSLKITQEEKKDSQPQVIMALAKDINDKAIEVAKILEDSKGALTSDVTAATTIGVPQSQTSTEPFIEGDEQQEESTSTVAISQPQTPAKKDLAQVISEVTLINEYISYSALGAMINLIESNRANNRREVTGLLAMRIREQEEQLASISEAIPLISSDFLIHERQVTRYANEAQTLLDEANKFMRLDNLSVSLAKLLEIKDTVGRAAVILQEVSDNGGLLKESSDEVSQSTDSNQVTATVIIQIVPSSTPSTP